MAPRQTQTKKTNSNSKKSQKTDNKRRLLIDASKPEETRVAVAQNARLQDFEVESLVRRQIKGNIYLAKVTRVEPSLQAAFVNYGGNRHGFLPFSEIHPDYYRIPVADRERLMAEQEEMERAAAEEAARIAEEEDRKAAEEEESTIDAKSAKDDDNIEEVDDEDDVIEAGAEANTDDSENNSEDEDEDEENDSDDDETAAENNDDDNAEDGEDTDDTDDTDQKSNGRRRGRGRGRGRHNRRGGGRGGRKYAVSKNREDRVSDDEDDDLTSVEPFWKRIRRAYKIQEVIKRGQIMLIQVGKEERGNKGAAVTTYITLPGRYCVLMPNTPQSGGVSRKIENYKDRKRMREILKDLNVPDGMSVILRTAGTTRTKAEIKRDLDYLMRLWNNARDLTLQSTAPALINEEGSLIKRAIRDIYNKDIDEVVVSGDEGYKTARDMMKMLMPSHVKKVRHYKDATPLFIKEKLENQIEAMHSPQVELKSGGYLVINPTEALVSIDVNSGRATKERNIDETALRTNIEAAEEIARQLRLRDLGGLVVIDFIDMDHRRYNGKVERAMRDALAGDRARIQIGRISSFGLMEMSRQRLHPSLTEAHFETCPHCHGMGIVKTVDTMALSVLRAIEETALERAPADMTVTLINNEVIIYLLNHHRCAITDLEDRYNITVALSVGTVEGERGFAIETQKKKIVQPTDTDDEDDVSQDDDVMDKTEADTEEQDQEKPKKSRSRNNRNRKSKKDQIEDSETSETIDENQPKDTTPKEEAEEEPAKPKKRGRPAKKKKIEIEEVTEDQNPEAEAISATNDNADNVDHDDAAAPVQEEEDTPPRDENIAAREAETVNEAPKKKKRGWWNRG